MFSVDVPSDKGIEGGKFIVLFKHDKYSPIQLPFYVYRPRTICTIAEDHGAGSKIENGTIIAQDQACCYFRDTPVKELGRKYSLAKALWQAGFTKQQRTVFWKAYHTKRIGQG